MESFAEVLYGYDVFILDTAGRMHISENLMDEIIQIKSKINPNEIMFACTGTIGEKFPLHKIKENLASKNYGALHGDTPKYPFKNSLIGKKKAIIAEIKKASPSAGIISKDFDPIKIARRYKKFGASALSILTEEDYFLGKIN